MILAIGYYTIPGMAGHKVLYYHNQRVPVISKGRRNLNYKFKVFLEGVGSIQFARVK